MADAAGGAVFDLLSELGGNGDEEPVAEEVGDAAAAPSAGDAAPAAAPPATNTRAGFFH